MKRLLFLGVMVLGCGALLACEDTVVTPIDDDGGDPTVDAGPGRDSGANDAGRTGNEDAGSPDAGGDPPRAPRLVVADANGLSIFEVDAIVRGSSPSPDVAVAITVGATDLVSTRQRLFVALAGGTDSVAYFDDPWALAAGATPTGAMPASAIMGPIGPTRVNGLGVASGDLWIAAGAGRISRFAGALAGAPMAAPTATFTHPFEQLEGYAYEPGSDRLFAGQISGAGVQVYQSASGASGDTPVDFALDDTCAGWRMLIASSRLVVACSPGGPGPMTLRIWNDVGALSAARSADVSIDVDEGGGGLGIWDLVVAEDALFVATSSGLRIWRGFAALSAARPEDERLDVGSLRRLAYASDGTLFGLAPRLAGSTVVMIRDATTTPDVFATLSGFDDPGDIAILE